MDFDTLLAHSQAPPSEATPLYLQYAALEEEHGLARAAMEVHSAVTLHFQLCCPGVRCAMDKNPDGVLWLLCMWRDLLRMFRDFESVRTAGV